jgi:hypothetical protein
MSLKKQPRKGPKRAPKRTDPKQPHVFVPKQLAPNFCQLCGQIEDHSTHLVTSITSGESTKIPTAWEKERARDFGQLRLLVAAYADASIADSWKGGGDPSDVPIIEKELELATLKLNRHIDMMEERYE